MEKGTNFTKKAIQWCKKHETKLFIIVVIILLCIIIYPKIFWHNSRFEKPRNRSQNSQNDKDTAKRDMMMMPGMWFGGHMPRD